MRNHGKGLGISINEPNRPQEFPKVEPLVYTFKPLTSWPARPHPEQERLDQFRAMQSRFI